MSSAKHLVISECEDGEHSGWGAFGFGKLSSAGGFSAGTLPAKTIALSPVSREGHDALTGLLKGFGVPPSITLPSEFGPRSLFRVTSTDAISRLKLMLPATVQLHVPGDVITLPAIGAQTSRVDHLDEIAVLDIPSSPPEATDNFLRQFSLRGKAAEMEARAQEASALLGDICLSGQTTMWYAPPNAGKTLCALRLTHDAITEGRIAAGNVYYFNADDSSLGLAQKLRIMDDLGAHTIAPGFKGFKNADLLNHIKHTAARDQARGTLIIIDTVKKFASLMDKRQSSEFADACRQYALRGGTILGLAHTAKNANPDGKQRYAGTTDLLEDFDAAYMISPMEGVGEAGQRVVQFTAMKRRGDNAEMAAYTYASENGISYEERLLSVQVVDPITVDDFKRVAAEQQDGPIIEAIGVLIGEGVNQKMMLAKAAAQRAGVSARAAIRILEAHTGTDPAQSRWRFSVIARGAKAYELLPRPPT